MIPVLAFLGLVWLSPQDPFVARRDAAAALNSRSPRFTIALADSHRSFRPGEKIPLVLSYDNLGRGWAKNEDVSLPHFADVVLDRTVGTARPLADYDRAYVSGGVCCGAPGGVVHASPSFDRIVFGADGVPYFVKDPPPPPPPPPPPVTITVLLNEGVRFDAPGHYRLYLADRHDAERIYPNAGRTPPLISNIVELDITARDAEWEDRTAAGALAILDGPSSDLEWTTAARTLRFLGSERAIDEMADRLGRQTSAPARLKHDIEFVLGLFGARDRARVIARMEMALDDAHRPLSGLYLETLTAIRMTPVPGAHYTAAQRQAQLKAYQRRRSLALKRARR